MAFQPCPNTVQVRLQATLNGQQVENVFHVKTTSAPDLTDLEAIRDVVNDWALGPYTARLSNQLSWVQLIVTDLTVEGGAQIVKDMTGEGGGDIAEPVKTNQDTIAIKLNTAKSGRSFRGRFYYLAIPSTFYSGPNDFTSAFGAATISMAQALIDNLATAGYALGVLSRFHGVDANHKPIPRVEGLITEVISASLTDLIVDSQRRRLPGRGS